MRDEQLVERKDDSTGKAELGTKADMIVVGGDANLPADRRQKVGFI